MGDRDHGQGESAEPDNSTSGRLARIEATLERIEGRLAPLYVVDLTTGAASEIRQKPVTRDGLDSRGNRVSWTEQQDPTSWTPGRVARLTPDATPGVVDPDDAAALQRMADASRREDVADKIEGADCASGREPMGEGEYKPYTDHIIWNEDRGQVERAALRAMSAGDDYVAKLRADTVDKRRESKRHARKWWLLWLA